MKNRRARLLACAFSLLAASGLGLSGAAAQTASPGLGYPPATAPNSFGNGYYAMAGGGLTFIGANSSTVALTTATFANYYDQTNGAGALLSLYVRYSTTKDCSGNAGGSALGWFETKAGQSFQSTYPGGFTLKPPAPGQYWCLMGDVSIQGNPTSYYLTMIAYTANLISGTVPSTVSAGVQAVSGAVPPIGHLP
ncbi:hypothetical protein [Methylocystis heyeri]|uniref:Uncharacterized protein n=1 Tax=Methylocystis heyeri TaxID=391905 RepID=A0A6B8KA58_9HYPH|nr:hypothetical protein [Methylocystis heyeri]QGM44976.1 hypothetical protein H2LOC_004325 [Methylocystis heyeri]